MSGINYLLSVIIDDISYIPQTREETDVLFVLLAERYETRSVIITSNLVFSQCDAIFKDPMTTKAAIDSIVHHTAPSSNSLGRADAATPRLIARSRKLF